MTAKELNEKTVEELRAELIDLKHYLACKDTFDLVEQSIDLL
jgi:hypothetical protein